MNAYVIIGALFLFTYAIFKWFRGSSGSSGFWKKQGVKEIYTSALGKIYVFFTRPLHEVEIENYQKYGRLYGINNGGKLELTIGNPEHIRLILSKDFQTFPNRRNFTVGSKISRSLITFLKGDDWKRVRSVVSPTFSTGRIKKMSSMVETCVKSLMANLEKNNGLTIDIKDYFGAYTMDVIASCAFGIRLDSHNDSDNSFVTAAREIFNRNAPYKMILAMLFPMKVLDFFKIKMTRSTFFQNVTQEIIQKRKSEKVQDKHDFLQLLINAQNESEDSKEKTISVDEMVAQCIVFFLAGYDTTASTLSYTAYNLALNPGTQKLLQAEIDSLWEKGQPEYDEIMNLTYLDAVISETLRLFTIAARIERVAVEDYIMDDIKIPKGTVVGVPICAIHRDEGFFPEADKFKPERFLPQNKDNILPYSYIPFGSGPRNCIGLRFALMEAKFALVNVIRHYEFVATDETRAALKFYVGTGLLQAQKIAVKVVKRNK